MNEFLYNELNKAWKTTCKVLFKEEIGELKEYEEWLSEYVKPAGTRKDKEGNDVYVFPDYYEVRNFIDFKRIDWNKRFEPLNINEIKDIDSIVEALKERFVYAGNIVLGKSQFVEKSTSIHESFYIYNSWRTGFSKHVFSSSMIKNSEKSFGVLGAGESSYLIKTIISHRMQRSFESYYSTVGSDIYYSSNVDDSQEVMFSFGLQGVSYAIGNSPLNRETYYRIKNSLLEQIAIELKDKKKIFSLMEIIEELGREEINKSEYKIGEIKEESPKMDRINRAFNKTTSILFKRELGNVEEYSDFLKKYTAKIYAITSAISKNKSYVAGYVVDFFNKRFDVSKRSVKLEEIRKIGKNFNVNVENIEVNKDKLKKGLNKIAFLSCEMKVGRNINVTKAVEFSNAIDCYNGSAFVRSKQCAYSFWPRESEYVFGGNMVFNSSFVINGYCSTSLNRAFEVDNCQNSSDIYFSHNVENVIEGMFNFNVKNLNYTIGNAKYEAETYRKIKSSLLEQIANELEAKKDLKWNIYNIGRF